MNASVAIVDRACPEMNLRLYLTIVRQTLMHYQRQLAMTDPIFHQLESASLQTSRNSANQFNFPWPRKRDTNNLASESFHPEISEMPCMSRLNQ